MDNAPPVPMMAWRFRRQHIVRMVAGAVLVVAVYFAISVYATYQREQRIAQTIKSNGGRIEYWFAGPTWVPRWVQARVSLLDRIDLVAIAGGEFDKDSLVRLTELTNLTRLSLVNSQFNDADLKYLKVLTNLEDLYLGSTPVTDAGLENLKGLSRLKFLDLNNTRVSDVGLGHLKGLTNLEWLRLQNTPVTDAGLESLKGLAKLRILDLDNTQVTDAGLEHLKGLSNLESLSLDNTQVTAEGLARLRKSLPKTSIQFPGTAARLQPFQHPPIIAKAAAKSAGRQVLDPLHYLATLTCQPGCLDHAPLYRDWPLPASITQLRSRLDVQYGPHTGSRHFVRVHCGPLASR